MKNYQNITLFWTRNLTEWPTPFTNSKTLKASKLLTDLRKAFETDSHLLQFNLQEEVSISSQDTIQSRWLKESGWIGQFSLKLSQESLEWLEACHATSEACGRWSVTMVGSIICYKKLKMNACIFFSFWNKEAQAFCSELWSQFPRVSFSMPISWDIWYPPILVTDLSDFLKKRQFIRTLWCLSRLITVDLNIGRRWKHLRRLLNTIICHRVLKWETSSSQYALTNHATEKLTITLLTSPLGVRLSMSMCK